LGGNRPEDFGKDFDLGAKNTRSKTEGYRNQLNARDINRNCIALAWGKNNSNGPHQSSESNEPGEKIGSEWAGFDAHLKPGTYTPGALEVDQ
jgi:hypothetical protein